MDHKSEYRQAEWVNISHETFCVHYPLVQHYSHKLYSKYAQIKIEIYLQCLKFCACLVYVFRALTG